MRFLLRPVRHGVVLNYLGQLMMLLGAGLLVPVPVAVLSAEWMMGLAHIGMGGVVAGLGWVMRRLTVESAIRPVEALVVGSVIYLVTTLALTPVMHLGGLAWDDAIFESMSSCTTTALSMIHDTSVVPRTILFTRSLMQWYGGLGFVILTLAVLVPPGSSASRLLTTQIEKSDIVPGAVAAAKSLARLYGAYTLATIALLLISGMGLFESVNHGLTTVSTAGFSTRNASVAGLWLPTLLVLIAFMLIGGLPLTLYRHLRSEGLSALTGDAQVRTLIALALLWVAVFAVLFATTDAEAGKGFSDALFLGVSLQTGTGFTTVAPAELSPLAKLVMLLPMNIGGALGSTAGAIKIYRVLVIGALLRMTIFRVALPPNVVKPFLVGGRSLGRDEVETVAAFVIGYVALLGLTTACFVATGHDALDALFECSSALGTSGFTVGLASSALPTWQKLLLTFNMWVGRVEIIPAALALYPPIWLRRRRK
ncbi:MAG: TrkH family potassium uptake protein [Armatimonadota bacterium]